MDEEEEDLLDIFADESDPLLSNDVEDESPAPDKHSVDKSEEESATPSETTKQADEATALAELPDYKPIVKDKDVAMDDKPDTNDSLAAVNGLDSEKIIEPLSKEQKINAALHEIISDNWRRENRKRPFNPSMGNAYGMRGLKQKYMTKNGVQLCLQPRNDITKLSAQEAGNELARCLDEPKRILMEDTISIIGLGRALELLAETTEIQENGGMTMQDGKIKRPGGVFITLLKQQITDDQMKCIFRRDRQLDNQSKKKRKRMKVRQDKAKVAQMKRRMDKELEKMEEKRWNKLKQELPDTGMEKRFGVVEDDQDGSDLMEVDENDLLVCNEDSMATTNENNQDNEVDSNHDNEVDSNHDNEVDSNHDNEVDNNHDNEVDSNHDNEVDGNHDNEVDSNHDNTVDGNHDNEIHSGEI